MLVGAGLLLAGAVVNLVGIRAVAPSSESRAETGITA
jgi:hypothetical protein